MNALQEELKRLYLVDTMQQAAEELPAAVGLVSSNAQVRAMVLELVRPADWNALSALWQGVQADLKWPAPAIAVNGVDGYQLWFSLEVAVDAELVAQLLQALQNRYLSTVAADRIKKWPVIDTATSQQVIHAALVPALQSSTGHWSAFVASDLAAIFAEEPWLDMTPSPVAQAAVLANITSIKPSEFEAACVRFASKKEVVGPIARPVIHALTQSTNVVRIIQAAVHSHDIDPRRFLQDVLNDPSIEMHLRVNAAKALLRFIFTNH